MKADKNISKVVDMGEVITMIPRGFFIVISAVKLK